MECRGAVAVKGEHEVAVWRSPVSVSERCLPQDAPGTPLVGRLDPAEMYGMGSRGESWTASTFSRCTYVRVSSWLGVCSQPPEGPCGNAVPAAAFHHRPAALLAEF